MKKFACLAMLAVPSLCLAAEPQSAAPAFEVASVKAAAEPQSLAATTPIFCLTPCTPGERLTVEGLRVDIRYMSLQRLIVTAYRIKPYQLSGPEWMRTQRFDIMARIPEGVSKDRVPEMLQTLLAERFKLSIHRENKEQTVSALVVGKNGSKLQEVAADVENPVSDIPGSHDLYTPNGDARMLDDGGFVVNDKVLGPLRGGINPGLGMRIEFLKITIQGLVELLGPHVDRPVIDMTNLKGAYHLLSEAHPPAGGGGRKGGGPPEPGAPSEPRPDPFGEGLFAAIEKAGLKLETRKAPVPVIVVDHLEKAPTAN